MIDEATMLTALERLEALDFRNIENHIAQLEAESAELSAAEATAARRTHEINSLIYDRPVVADGAAVVDRLLAGETAVSDLAPSRDALEAELRALSQACEEIRRRQERISRALEIARKGAHQAIAEALVDVVDELKFETTQAANRLLSIYASLEAIATVTEGNGRLDAMMIKRAIDGCRSHSSMWPRIPNSEIEVPADVVDLLEHTTVISPAFQPRLIKKVRPFN